MMKKFLLRVVPGMLCWCMILMIASTAFGEILFPKSSLVSQKCAACHKPDAQGRLEVIEETRKTPEEWKVVADRMIRLNSAPLDDHHFNPVIKELSRNLCLSPKEMSEVSYLNSDENSQYREIPKDDLEKRIFTACVRCHTFGKIASHRMTKSQWAETRNLHLGYYPTTVPQMREMNWVKESEDLIEPLAQRFSFDASEWKDWLKNRKDQDLTGEWKAAGYQPGLGYYEGTYVFKSNPQKGEDEYLVERTVRYLSGLTVKTSGEGTLFSEYHLRYSLAPTPLTGRIDGVFDLSASDKTFKGKWWTVVQDSNAYGNETFTKTDGGPKIIAVFPQSVKAGEKQKMTLIGVGLPKAVNPADITFSNPAVKAVSAVKPDENTIVCEITAGSASPGTLSVSVKDVKYENPILLFDKIDGIQILPKLGRARVSSGAAYPPQGVQFVARAVNFGADGKSGTEDDLILEPLDVKWQLEEEKTGEKDDDLNYLNAPIVNGLYTPVTTYGPIAERNQHREGVGLIAVTAVYTDGGKELKDRALLAVTVPDFVTHIK